MKIIYKNQLLFCFFFVVSTFFLSCATRNDAFVELDGLVQEQNFAQARETLGSEKEELYPETDKILYYLDDGMLAFHEKNFDDSIDQLSKAELHLEEAQTKQISKEALSFILNDTFKDYAGNDFERIFTNVFLSLGYLRKNDFDNGFVEMRRARNLIQKIQNNNRIIYDGYNNSEDARIKVESYEIPVVDTAFLRLLSTWVYRADSDLSNYEVALRNYQQAIEVQPGLYNFDPPVVNDVDVFSDYQSNPSLQVVAFTGRNPFRIEKGFSINTVNGVAVIRTFNEEIVLNEAKVKKTRDSTVLGEVFPLPEGLTINARFSLPELAVFTPRVRRVDLSIDAAHIGSLQRTESLENMSVRIFESEKDFIYAKTISRVVGKAIISGLASSKLKESDSMAGFIADIAGAALSHLTERADLRTARYFPAEIWTGDFLLIDYETDKTYKVTLSYYDQNDVLLHSETLDTTLKMGVSSLNLLTSSYLR